MIKPLLERIGETIQKRGLWGHLVNYSVLRDSYAWAIIDEFIDWDYEEREECLLFFNDEDVFFNKNKRDLFKLIDQGDSFNEFYITNFETNYLLGFSHEDTLHGCGIAKRWVDSLKGTKHHDELL